MKRKIKIGWECEIQYGYGNIPIKIYKHGSFIIKSNGRDGYDLIKDGKVIDSDPKLKDLMKYCEQYYEKQ